MSGHEIDRIPDTTALSELDHRVTCDHLYKPPNLLASQDKQDYSEGARSNAVSMLIPVPFVKFSCKAISNQNCCHGNTLGRGSKTGYAWVSGTTGV